MGQTYTPRFIRQKEAEIKDRKGPRRPYTLNLKRLHPNKCMWHGYHKVTNQAQVFYLTAVEEKTLHGPGPQSWFNIQEGAHSVEVAPVEEMINMPSHTKETKARLQAELKLVGAVLPAPSVLVGKHSVVIDNKVVKPKRRAKRKRASRKKSA